MRAEVKFNPHRNMIKVRPVPVKQSHYSGTVALSNVTFGNNSLKGDIVSELGNSLMPRKLHGWRSAVFQDGYFDKDTGNQLVFAKAAYLVGQKIFYLPSEATNE